MFDLDGCILLCWTWYYMLCWLFSVWEWLFCGSKMFDVILGLEAEYACMRKQLAFGSAFVDVQMYLSLLIFYIPGWCSDGTWKWSWDIISSCLYGVVQDHILWISLEDSKIVLVRLLRCETTSGLQLVLCNYLLLQYVCWETSFRSQAEWYLWEGGLVPCHVMPRIGVLRHTMSQTFVSCCVQTNGTEFLKSTRLQIVPLSLMLCQQICDRIHGIVSSKCAFLLITCQTYVLVLCQE